jgi:hypothetical protein
VEASKKILQSPLSNNNNKTKLPKKDGQLTNIVSSVYILDEDIMKLNSHPSVMQQHPSSSNNKFIVGQTEISYDDTSHELLHALKGKQAHIG